MTLKAVESINRWNCVSSDDFPDTGIQEGSTIHVIDTGEEKIYHNGMWEDDLRRINAERIALGVV